MVKIEKREPRRYTAKDFINESPYILENDHPFATLIGMINTFHMIAEENDIKPSEVGPNYAIYNSYKREGFNIVRSTEVITPRSDSSIEMVDFNNANARGIRSYADGRDPEEVHPKDITRSVESMQVYLQMMQEIVSDTLGIEIEE